MFQWLLSKKNIFIVCLLFGLSVHAKSLFEFQQRIILPENLKSASAGAPSVSPFGGISAITYIESEQKILMLSDDRGKHGEPRWYEYLVKLNKQEQVELEFVKQVQLKGFKGNTDPEGIAILPWGGVLISCEGDYNIKPRVAPRLMEFKRDGSFVRQYDLPAHWLPNLSGKLKTGARNNRGPESLAQSLDGQIWAVALESHLAQGPRNFIEMAFYRMPEAWKLEPFRLLQYPLESAQVESLAYGVSEVLFLDEKRMLFLERVVNTKALNVEAKLYSVDLPAADVSGMSTDNIKSVEKKTLLLDLSEEVRKRDSAKRSLLNFEGVAWGPKLKSGRHLIFFINDNNFLPLDTELWVFSYPRN